MPPGLQYATVVVVPSLLTGPDSAAALLEKLEIHYLANSDARLRFALLTDFADAPHETMPEDEGYVRSALEIVKALNERYSEGGPDKFFVFHRRIFSRLQDDPNLAFEQTPLINLAHEGQLMAYQHDGFWQSMDNNRDFRYLNDLWAKGRAPWFHGDVPRLRAAA